MIDFIYSKILDITLIWFQQFINYSARCHWWNSDHFYYVISKFVKMFSDQEKIYYWVYTCIISMYYTYKHSNIQTKYNIKLYRKPSGFGKI